VTDAIDAAVSHMEYLGNLQSGEANPMELDDRSLHRIGTLYGIQKSLARFLSTSLDVSMVKCPVWLFPLIPRVIGQR
jgi:hypothetical protein